jgi:hypothetical protein
LAAKKGITWPEQQIFTRHAAESKMTRKRHNLADRAKIKHNLADCAFLKNTLVPPLICFDWF